MRRGTQIRAGTQDTNARWEQVHAGRLVKSRMKLLYISIMKHQGEDKLPIALASAENLDSFSYFTRGTIREHIEFGTRTVCQRTKAGFRQSVGLKDIPFLVLAHVRTDGLSAMLVADEEYPDRVAFSVLTKVMADFDKATVGKWKNVEKDIADQPQFLKTALTEYQNPENGDKLMKLQNSINEVKQIMHKNIDDILRRGETLDTLMDKSEDLSVTSVQFFKTARRQNQCCKAY